MILKMYSPEPESSLIYIDKDGSVEKILYDDLLDILEKDIGIPRGNIEIHSVLINVGEYKQYFDPSFPICYADYIITIVANGYNIHKYVIKIDGCGYIKNSIGIENTRTNTFVFNYEDSIKFSRKLYEVYNYKYAEYIKKTIMDNKEEEKYNSIHKRKRRRYRGNNNANNYRHKNKIGINYFKR